MAFPGNTTYDPETLAALGQAFDAAWHELQSAVLPVDATLAREELAAPHSGRRRERGKGSRAAETSRARGLSAANALNLMQRGAERCLARDSFGYCGISPTTFWLAA